MAKRVATVYVNAMFKLSSQELRRFIKFMEEQTLSVQVLILDNGNQSLVLEDVAGKEEIRLNFERQYDGYVCDCPCQISKTTLTNVLRKAVTLFKGHATAKRKYDTHELIYQYYNGALQSIIERRDEVEKIIFMKQNNQEKLQYLFDSRFVEYEIRQLKLQIDELLDCRTQAEDYELIAIDQTLELLSKRLFVLEA